MISNLKDYLANPHFRTIGLVFAVNSLLLGSWITRLPEIKEKLEIGEGELGIALLGLPIGSILIMPFMGKLIQLFGSGRITLVSGFIFCFLSTFPVLAPTYFLLITTLIILGISTGAMDIAMNASAAAIEKRFSRAIMSTSHGMWSIGGMIGAAVTSLLAGLEISANLQIIVTAILMVFLLYGLRPRLLTIKDTESEPVRFSWPGRPVLGLAVISFCIMMGEGAIMDWSTIYLRHTLMADAFYAGLGFAGFSFSMALGRFFGDRLLDKYGAGRLVFGGALIGLTGLSVGLFLPHVGLAIAGFTIAGLGFSCLIPSIYISAANVPGQPAGKSIAEVAGLGYFGLFAGPPLIGFIAEGYGLDVALGIIIVLLMFVLLIAGRIKFHR